MYHQNTIAYIKYTLLQTRKLRQGRRYKGGKGGDRPPKNFLSHIGAPVTPTLGPFQKQKKHKTPLLRFKNSQYMGPSVNIAPLSRKLVDAPDTLLSWFKTR